MYDNPIRIKFSKILEKVFGEELFDDNGDGSLSTTVHTGGTMEAFSLNVEFTQKSIIIATSAFLAVEGFNMEQVSTLLTSINEYEESGTFCINDENLITYSIMINYNDFAALDNPFDFIFFGCEKFKINTRMILKALAGEVVLCMRE